MAARPADFTYHHSFRYHARSARFVVWTISLPYALRHLGRSRLVSTLSHAEHGLSSGLPSARPVKGSPNLTPVHPRVSPWRTRTSPLRLPIPPPGQDWPALLAGARHPPADRWAARELPVPSSHTRSRADARSPSRNPSRCTSPRRPSEMWTLGEDIETLRKCK